MRVPTTWHAKIEDVADDVGHAIPSLNTLDVYAPSIGGGAKLAIVVAAPLGCDSRSLQRLMSKLEGYLGFVNSASFEQECGVPRPDNASVIVYLHHESDPATFDLIARCRPWAIDNRVTLSFELLASDE